MTRRHPNKWKAWTPEEVSTLQQLQSEGVPMKVIAKQLGRTEEAVEKRARVGAWAPKAPPDPSSLTFTFA